MSLTSATITPSSPHTTTTSTLTAATSRTPPSATPSTLLASPNPPLATSHPTLTGTAPPSLPFASPTPPFQPLSSLQVKARYGLRYTTTSSCTSNRVVQVVRVSRSWLRMSRGGLGVMTRCRSGGVVIHRMGMRCTHLLCRRSGVGRTGGGLC